MTLFYKCRSCYFLRCSCTWTVHFLNPTLGWKIILLIASLAHESIFFVQKLVNAFSHIISLTLESFCLVYFVIFIALLIFQEVHIFPQQDSKWCNRVLRTRVGEYLGGNIILKWLRQNPLGNWVILIFSGHKNCESTGKIMKISYARCHVVKFDIIFLGLSRQIFFGVITDN